MVGMVEDNVDLSFISKLLQKNNDEFRGLRKEVADIRRLCIQTYDYMRRTERHHAELRDDLELTIKMEVGGSLAYAQTSLESVLGRIEEKIDSLSDRIHAVEAKF